MAFVRVLGRGAVRHLGHPPSCCSGTPVSIRCYANRNKYDPGRHVFSDADALGVEEGLDEATLSSKAFATSGKMKGMLSGMARDKYQKYSRVLVRERERLVKPFRLPKNFSHEDGAEVLPAHGWTHNTTTANLIGARKRPSQVSQSVKAAVTGVLTGDRRWGYELGYPDLKISDVEVTSSLRRVSIRWTFYDPEDATKHNLALIGKMLKKRLRDLRRYVATKVNFKYQPEYTLIYDTYEEERAAHLGGDELYADDKYDDEDNEELDEYEEDEDDGPQMDEADGSVHSTMPGLDDGDGDGSEVTIVDSIDDRTTRD